MELHNKAQSKKFVARSAVVEHRGSVGTFVLQPNRVEKSFVNTHALTTSEYPSRSAATGRTISSAQNRNANTPGSVETSSVRDIHSANAPHNAGTNSRMFADQHQFREQGKSQKTLDRQNPPMTIDQVRELLNKNK